MAEFGRGYIHQVAAATVLATQLSVHVHPGHDVSVDLTTTDQAPWLGLINRRPNVAAETEWPGPREMIQGGPHRTRRQAQVITLPALGTGSAHIPKERR